MKCKPILRSLKETLLRKPKYSSPFITSDYDYRYNLLVRSKRHLKFHYWAILNGSSYIFQLFIVIVNSVDAKSRKNMVLSVVSSSAIAGDGKWVTSEGHQRKPADKTSKKCVTLAAIPQK